MQKKTTIFHIKHVAMSLQAFSLMPVLEILSNEIFQCVTQNKHNSKQNTNSSQQNGEAVALSTQSNLRNLNWKLWVHISSCEACFHHEYCWFYSVVHILPTVVSYAWYNYMVKGMNKYIGNCVLLAMKRDPEMSLSLRYVWWTVYIGNLSLYLFCSSNTTKNFLISFIVIIRNFVWISVKVVLTEPSQPPSLSNAPRLISPPCYEYNKQEDVSVPTFQIMNPFPFAFSVDMRPRFFGNSTMFY